MRRRQLWGVLLTASVLSFGALTACSSSTPTEPTLGTVNFQPRLLIDIGSSGVSTAKGPRDDGTVSLNPTVVGSGTVVEIKNSTKVDHRLQGDGGRAFDTGILRPGATTTVVLVNNGTDDKTIQITDPTDPVVATTITVHPKPAS